MQCGARRPPCMMYLIWWVVARVCSSRTMFDFYWTVRTATQLCGRPTWALPRSAERVAWQTQPCSRNGGRAHAPSSCHPVAGRDELLSLPLPDKQAKVHTVTLERITVFRFVVSLVSLLYIYEILEQAKIYTSSLEEHMDKKTVREDKPNMTRVATCPRRGGNGYPVIRTVDFMHAYSKVLKWISILHLFLICVLKCISWNLLLVTFLYPI